MNALSFFFFSCTFFLGRRALFFQSVASFFQSEASFFTADRLFSAESSFCGATCARRPRPRVLVDLDLASY